MSIEQTQNISVNEALKAMSDYRSRANIQAVKKQYIGHEQDTLLSIEDAASTSFQPRIGRYVNIQA